MMAIGHTRVDSQAASVKGPRSGSCWLLLSIVVCLAACGTKKEQPNPDILALTVEWVIPTMREGDIPLSADEIKGYNVHYRRCGASDWMPTWRAGGESTSMDFDLPKGCYEFRVNAQDSNGLTSPWTPIIQAQ
jgi:hypothetical protein